MTAARSTVRRKAMCPDCGRVKVWLGEVFAEHRRAEQPNRPRPAGGIGVPMAVRQSVPCAGSGRPIEDRHLREG